MKKLVSFLAVAVAVFSAAAQAPNLISFQAVVRDTANNVVASKPVGIRISILQSSVKGVAVYEETQTPVTNAVGLFSIKIGAGTVVTGSITAINWAAGPYFIKTETDPNGGTSYTITGTTQLLSVPYAMYAANSGPAGANYGDMLFWNGAQWTPVPVGLAGQQLMLRPTPQGPQPFWFGISVPVFTTLPTASITSQTVVLGANVTSFGGAPVPDGVGVGVIVSTQPIANISIADSLFTNKLLDGLTYSYTQPQLGNNTYTVSGLKANTQYYVEAYAANAATDYLNSPLGTYSPIFWQPSNFYHARRRATHGIYNPR